MAYVVAADFTLKGRKAWTIGCTLGPEVDTSLLGDVITLISNQVESDLGDVFEPPSPDNDVTIEVHATGGQRLFLPRRVRSITSVKTRSATGALTTESSSLWRLVSSTVADEFSDNPYDFLEIIEGQNLSTGLWPSGVGTVQVIGKFGWASTPFDIKRLVSLLVHDFMTTKTGQHRRAQQVATADATWTLVASDRKEYGIPEADRIAARFHRSEVLAR